MSITSDSAQKIIRLLNQKVRDGLLDKITAEKLSVLALEEVAPMEDEAIAVDEEIPAEPPAEVVEPETQTLPPPAIDPKTRILALLTDFEKQADRLFNDMKQQVTKVIEETEGAAFPLGSFDVKAKDNISKLVIDHDEAKNNAVRVRFSFDRNWLVENVNPPTAVESQTETSCHVPLRKDLLALASDIEGYSESEFSWKRKGLPVGIFSQIAREAEKANDGRVKTIVAAAPFEKSASDWKAWSIAAQTYLVGTDFSSRKSFDDVLQEVRKHAVSEQS